MVESIREALNVGKSILKNYNMDEREARLLLALSMDISTDELIKFDKCDDKQYSRYLDYIKRRVSGEPFAYIAGHKEFMKLNFVVTPDVLIPRDDTEILVLEAIKQNKKRILDLCTGSGCIAISLAKYIENSKVDAVDICEKALNVAKRNADLNNVEVNFICSNLFENVLDKYDMIVSNPPYIRTSEIDELQNEVKCEPKKALDGGVDGLYFYTKISEEASEYLNDNGIMLFEIGFDEGEAVKDILKSNCFVDIRIIKDLSGNDRVIYAKKGVK